jgi:hypothetical protein
LRFSFATAEGRRSAATPQRRIPPVTK